ncbi:hypothetical protein B0H11DRAFT_2252188 [Mycena galericulata]|nr:hypothetical protein B0H11DRAFT_2252188 [Mycena galericulata]
MDAAELDSIIVALRDIVVTRYASAAGFVILLYDHLLTFDAEVKYIWSAPTSLGKIMFLTLRYMVPAFLFVQTTLGSGLSNIQLTDALYPPRQIEVLTHSPRCKVWVSIMTYAGWITIGISNFLVLMRIWAILPHGHRLRAWSIAFFIASQLTSFAVTTWVIVANLIPVLVFDPLVALCSFSSKPNVVGLWVVGLVFEVVVFVAVCWNTLDRPRALGSDPDAAVARILLRDGIAYFLILFGFRIANTVIAAVSPVSSLFVVVYFIWCGTTVTTTRLIINSRRTAAKEARLRELRMSASYGQQCDPDFTSDTFSESRTEMLPRRSR